MPGTVFPGWKKLPICAGSVAQLHCWTSIIKVVRDVILRQTLPAQGRRYRAVWQEVLINRYLSQVLIISKVIVTLHQDRNINW